MKRKYLGDSYDAVKRLWQQVLVGWAPLYAAPQFVPQGLRNEFERLTGIPVWMARPAGEYSILNDPDTGIRLPGESNQREGQTHIAIATIIKQLREQGPRCVVTFDQSDYRESVLNRPEQRGAKLRSLRESGLFGFYYVSHAPFLFAFPRAEDQQGARQLLIGAGIPKVRLEALPGEPA